MKTENKVFIGGVVVTCLITAGFIVYQNTGIKTAPTSNVAFNQKPEQLPQDQVAKDQRTVEPPKKVRGKEKHQIIQDPVPVTPAERGDGKVAKFLREIKTKTDGLSNRVQENRFVINNLKHQISRINKENEGYESEVKNLVDENDDLREELSGKRLYSADNRKAEKKDRNANKNSLYQLTKVADDQAWIKTSAGRTYIVEEGDWFVDDYVVRIDAVENRVITSAGVLVL